MVRISHISFAQRAAEKEAARRADDLAVAEGRKSSAQVKRESESFAFGPERARHVLSSPQPRFDEYQLYQ
jgi:hypothetical protein